MNARLALVAVLLTGTAACESTEGAAPAVPAPTTTTATPQTSSCDYRRTPDAPSAGKDVGLPTGLADPDAVTLETNHGDITMTMSDATPCTRASIAHLVTSGFYDGSPCHRMTKAESLSVLQCGDPSGLGTGGPGYTVPDENPTDLKPTGTRDYVTYPRGTVAMANSGEPHSGGSQFFLVYADSTLPPTYAVFARLTEEGLAVLDEIAQQGVAGGARDGAPAVGVTVEHALAA
ncbi:peptidylprolyl isomerase [Actinokineospora sp. NPDC004072]